MGWIAVLKDFGFSYVVSLVEFKHTSLMSGQLCQSPSKAWVSVGELCDSLHLSRHAEASVSNHWQVNTRPGLRLWLS